METGAVYSTLDAVKQISVLQPRALTGLKASDPELLSAPELPFRNQNRPRRDSLFVGLHVITCVMI